MTFFELQKKQYAFKVKSLVMLRILRTLLCVALAVFDGPSIAFSDEPASFDTLEYQYDCAIRPLLTQFCMECHSTEQKEGELDLERFGNFDDVQHAPLVWQKVRPACG